VAGLADGAEVRVGGLQEGTVRRIILPNRADGKLTVQMDSGTNTRDVVKKDSMASIRTEGLVGDKYVDLSFGSNEAEKVRGRRHHSQRAAAGGFRRTQENQPDSKLS
jgi:phospholipid/cholesterol/gamma-HCH transport system substrate-binding protein